MITGFYWDITDWASIDPTCIQRLNDYYEENLNATSQALDMMIQDLGASDNTKPPITPQRAGVTTGRPRRLSPIYSQVFKSKTRHNYDITCVV